MMIVSICMKNRNPHHDAVRAEFQAQATSWAGLDHHENADIDWVVQCIAPRRSDSVLDVGAGSGLLARALAPHVRQVRAIDLTPAMLTAGRDAARREHLTNIAFDLGAAESLPYADGSFTLVVSRFVLHHLTDVHRVLREMARVAASDHRVAIIDITAPDDPAIAERYNALERLRDPTHTIALSQADLARHIADVGLEVISTQSRDVTMNLATWLDFTATDPERRARITSALVGDHQGLSEPTGFRPEATGATLTFRHRWTLCIASVRPRKSRINPAIVSP